MPLPRITHKRQLVQGVLIVTVLLLPFISLSGNPFLRMDIARMTLFLAGMPLRIDQFYLLLLVILLFVSLFLLVTAILGRVWCGWLCPQTVFNDLAELLGRIFCKKSSAVVTRLVEHLVALFIALLIAFNLFCWFLAPQQVTAYLLSISDHQPMFIAYVMATLCGYLNLIVVKRSFCRSYCPYGRFQTALMDTGTLNLSFLEETRDRCLRCNACARTCPMDIDIRTGFQIECISCGRCIDACRAVMERKPEGTGLIDYRFGTIKGTRFRFGTTTVVLLLVSVLLSVGLVWGVLSRSQSAFAVQRVATAETRLLPDGSVAQPWKAIVGNRSEMSQVYSIKVSSDSTDSVELLGQVRDIRVAANQHREVTFMIHFTKNSRQPEKIQLQLFRDNQPVTLVTISP